MKKLFPVLILAIVCTSASYAQDGLFQIVPQWQLGDSRIVEVESQSTIFISDSLITDISVTMKYHVSVIDTVGHYTLLYRQDPNNIDIELNSSEPALDSASAMVRSLLLEITDALVDFEYRVQVDRSTGLAFNVINSTELLDKIQKSCVSLIGEFGKKMQKNDVDQAEMEELLKQHFTTYHPQMIETVINGVNSIIQAHAYVFPLDETVSQEIMVHDVNTLGEFGNTEFPAVQTISSKEMSDGKLLVHTKLEYDKTFLLEQMQRTNEMMKKVDESDFSIIETEDVIFDLESTWIVSHTSDVSFEMPGIKTLNRTITRFK